jgi:hypothetical protein
MPPLDRLVLDPRFSLSVRLLLLYASRGAMLTHVWIAPAELSTVLQRQPATVRRTLHTLTLAGYLTATPYRLARGGRGYAYRIRPS